MFGVLNKALITRGATIARPWLVRRMSVHHTENPVTIGGSAFMVAGIGIGVVTGLYVHFSGLVVWGIGPKDSAINSAE